MTGLVIQSEWSYKNKFDIQGLQIYKGSNKSKHFYCMVKMARNFITLKCQYKDYSLQTGGIINLGHPQYWPLRFPPPRFLCDGAHEQPGVPAKCSNSSNSATWHFGCCNLWQIILMNWHELHTTFIDVQECVVRWEWSFWIFIVKSAIKTSGKNLFAYAHILSIPVMINSYPLRNRVFMAGSDFRNTILKWRH